MKFYASDLFSKVLVCILISIESGRCQKIKLTEIDHLTFHKDRLTTGRRLSPVSQLKCDSNLYLISYSNCYKFQPQIVHCYNRNVGGLVVQWECKADLDKRVQFSVLKVSCEGYEYTSDPYVLIGSCGLEYSLETRSPKSFNDYYGNNLYGPSRLSNVLTFIILVIIMLFIYKSCCKKTQQSEVDANYPFDRLVNGTDNSQIGFFPPPPPPYELINNTELKNESLPVTNNRNINELNLSNNNSSITGPTNNNAGSRVYTEENHNARSDNAIRSESPPPAYEATDSSTGSVDMGNSQRIA